MSSFFETYRQCYTSYKAFKFFLLITIFCFSSNINAQVGIINDSDGFTNVRTEANSSSEIIHVLYDNEMFYYDAYDLVTNDWIEIYIPKNKFLENSYNCNESSDLKGFIHKSRLKDIEELSLMRNKNFSFKYILKEFELKNNIIDYYDSNIKFQVTKINGRYVYGQDGGLPKIETTDIKVFLDDKKIIIPRVLFENLYECDNNFNIRVNKDCFFVSQWNSDGAGAYFVVWAIDKTGLLQRLIFIP